MLIFWVTLFAWVLIATLWPLPRKDKMWGNLIFALILASWKLVYRYYWEWHWQYIAVVITAFFCISYIYTIKRLNSIRNTSNEVPREISD